jgi:hypothetical protein
VLVSYIKTMGYIMNKNDFITLLETRREKIEINKGTIHLENYDEFLKVSEFFKGKLVKPIHAAKMLSVSRAMIFQLEKEGKVRAFRLVFTDEVWKTIPAHLKLLISRSDVYIWIPIEDIEKYAKDKCRRLKKVKGYYINEFYG